MANCLPTIFEKIELEKSGRVLLYTPGGVIFEVYQIENIFLKGAFYTCYDEERIYLEIIPVTKDCFLKYKDDDFDFFYIFTKSEKFIKKKNGKFEKHYRFSKIKNQIPRKKGA